MSLIEHAEREMKLAGLYNEDADYAGMLPDAVIALIKAHAEQGHSGGSHYSVIDLFNRLANYKTLTPLDSNPEHWHEVGNNVWQSIRSPSVFSQDGGKTWYDIDDKKKKNWPNRSWLQKHLLDKLK